MCSIQRIFFFLHFSNIWSVLSLNVRNVKIESLSFLLRLALGWTLSVERNESDKLMRIKLCKTNFLEGYL